MIDFIKKNIFIIATFLTTLSVGLLTFFTFIDKSFIKLNEKNLQFLLLANIILLVLFFITIFFEVKKSFKRDIKVRGINTNKKYIGFFALFTLIPSILISVFSLFLFSFGMNKYLDKKITTAVNNSYELAKSYVEETKSKVQSEIILIAFDLNRSANFLKNNPNEFKRFLKTQKIIRDVDEIHIIDNNGKLILSSLLDETKYVPPLADALKLVLTDDRPLKILNAYQNQSASIIRLSEYNDKFLYAVKLLDKKIAQYLTESQQAVNFYYTVENKRTGIKISFVFIYLVIVTLLLFLTISIGIKFSSRFFRSINNLISASTKIGEGDFDIRVPEIKSDNELEILNKNFNLMINKLKNQQEKLIIEERHEAWSSVARKLAHEIKNPLTPIQLTIDRLKNKYLNKINVTEQKNFDEYLKIINKQIKQIETLVNEFSDFARMPKPVFKKIDLIAILNDNIKLLKELDSSITINFKSSDQKILYLCDNDQINRVFFNLIKNSVESIQEKYLEMPNFNKKIDIEILEKSDYIRFIILDNGKGFEVTSGKIKDILNPYFTTKKKGSGLGLSIVNKIINDHNGTIDFLPQNNGAKVEIFFKKNVS